MSLVNILSTDKIDLDLTLYCFCGKNLSMLFIFYIVSLGFLIPSV